MTEPPSEPTPMPPGWYPAPENQFQTRYWDGAQWTSRTRRKAVNPAVFLLIAVGLVGGLWLLDDRGFALILLVAFGAAGLYLYIPRRG